MSDNIQVAATVVCGLAFFIYGIGLMSEGLAQIAGSRIKAALGYVTRNRFAAIAAGAGITALMQSSSATTVMTVGFVNAGLMSLEQAIGVIFGANIGTTITGQIVALKVADLAMPSIILGVVGLVASKRYIVRSIWRALLGFGLLFFGMEMMSHELKALAQHPGFIAFFSRFDCAPLADGFLPLASLLGAILVGTLCTVAVQSSSATIGITIALANSGAINLWTAVPIVMGDNIGTTVTAALAAIGTNVNARRTALAHALFNVVGTVLLVSTFALVVSWRGTSAPVFYHIIDFFADGNGLLGANPGRHVAMAHTLFNVANVAVLSFFIPLLVRLCVRIIPDESSNVEQPLEPRLLANPALAIDAAKRALADMTRRSWVVASASLNNCLGRATVDEASVQSAEREIDSLQTKIRDYIVLLSQRKLNERQAQILPELLHCVNDAERISDIAVKIYRKTARVQREGLSDEILSGTNTLMSEARTLAFRAVHALRTGEAMELDAPQAEAHMVSRARALSRKFAEELSKAAPDTPHDVAFLTVLSGLKDVARHLGNIAERIPSVS